MTEALQTVFGEFRVINPDITNAIVFRADGETLATTEGTTPEQTQTLIANLKSITHTECIGGIENLTIQDINTQLSVTAIDEIYFAAVSSSGADQKIVKSLTKVVAPTVIRLALGVPLSVPEKPQPLTDTNPQKNEIRVLPAQEETTFEPILEPVTPPEPFLPKAPTTQFMVEKIGGMLVPTDTVRIDSEIIEKWKELYENRHFYTVHIESLEGKTVTCKFKSIKDIKAGAKGIIQIPERIIQCLESGKGKLVIVKPVVEEASRF